VMMLLVVSYMTEHAFDEDQTAAIQGHQKQRSERESDDGAPET